MSLREQLNADLKTALKAKDQMTMSTIRLIVAAIKERDIAERGKGHAEGIGEGEILSLLQTMIKQRRESANIYREGGRPELAEREDCEVEIIERFLPKQMNDNELSDAISSLIEETGANSIKDMGKIMGALKSKYAGQVDMTRAGAVVKEKLVG